MIVKRLHNITVYLHKPPNLTQPWNNSCYITITMDQSVAKYSTIDNDGV